LYPIYRNSIQVNIIFITIIINIGGQRKTSFVSMFKSDVAGDDDSVVTVSSSDDECEDGKVSMKTPMLGGKRLSPNKKGFKETERKTRGSRELIQKTRGSKDVETDVEGQRR
jgi:hypothetical protein